MNTNIYIAYLIVFALHCSPKMKGTIINVYMRNIPFTKRGKF